MADANNSLQAVASAARQAQRASAGTSAIPPQAQAALASAANATPVYETAVHEWRKLAHQELEALRQAHKSNSHKEKMVDTILALVDAQISGNPETAVFDREDTCSERTYYTNWKQDPAFARCLENVGKIAREWKDTRAVGKLKEAAERMQIAAPDMVAMIIAATYEAMKDNDWRAVFQGGFGVLDRAGVQTATKQGSDAMAFLQSFSDNLDLDKLSTAQMERIVEGEHPFTVILEDYLVD